MKKILLVGAGAIGCAYGYTAFRGGASVSYLVKPKHVPERKDGIPLYHHHVFEKAPDHVLFKDFRLFDSIASIPEDERFDTVIVSVPSNALHAGDWPTELGRHASVASSYWLNLSPGLDDGDYLIAKSGIPRERVADGSIPILSYWAPLPGQAIERPGYAFWAPPGANILLSPKHLGESTKAELRIAHQSDPAIAHWQALAEIFTRGGLPSKIKPKYRRGLLLGDPALRCVTAALERSEWSFQKLMHGPNLTLASEAAREMSTIYAELIGEPDPMRSWLKRRALSPFALRHALSLAARLAPFDLEAFFQVHFTKVEDQMHGGIKYFIAEGAKRKLPTNYLRQL